MPSPPWAFLLDENMPKRAATALRSAGYSAVRVVEVGYERRRIWSSLPMPAHVGSLLLHGMLISLPPNISHLMRVSFSSLPGVPERAVVDPLLAALTSLQGQDLTNKVYLVEPEGPRVT